MLDTLLASNTYALARGKDDAHNTVSSAEEEGAGIRENKKTGLAVELVRSSSQRLQMFSGMSRRPCRRSLVAFAP